MAYKKKFKIEIKSALIGAAVGVIVGDVLDITEKIPFLRPLIDKIKGGA